MLRIIGLLLFSVLLTGCGYDGHYRYPCQDPAKWETAECKPPICTVNKICPEDLNSNLKEKMGVNTNE